MYRHNLPFTINCNFVAVGIIVCLKMKLKILWVFCLRMLNPSKMTATSTWAIFWSSQQQQRQQRHRQQRQCQRQKQRLRQRTAFSDVKSFFSCIRIRSMLARDQKNFSLFFIFNKTNFCPFFLFSKSNFFLQLKSYVISFVFLNNHISTFIQSTSEISGP